MSRAVVPDQDLGQAPEVVQDRSEVSTGFVILRTNHRAMSEMVTKQRMAAQAIKKRRQKQTEERSIPLLPAPDVVFTPNHAPAAFLSCSFQVHTHTYTGTNSSSSLFTHVPKYRNFACEGIGALCLLFWPWLLTLIS